MARNTYDTCRAIMIDLQGRGFETEAPRRDVMNSVIAIAGETRATRDRYMNTLKKYGFIRQKGGGIFALDFGPVDNDGEMGLIGELTRRISRLETMMAKMNKSKEAEHDG